MRYAYDCRGQVLAYEVTLQGIMDGTLVNWVTTLLTLLALAVLCYRFFCDIAFKIYEFLENNERNTIQTDTTDPFSFMNLDALWFGSRIARLSAATLKLHPMLVPSFLAEFVITSIHSPPLTYNAVITSQESGSVAKYRIETFLVSFMCLRLYVLARVVRSHIANRYSGAKYAQSLYFSPACILRTPPSKHGPCINITLSSHSRYRYWLIAKFSKTGTARKMTTWFAVKVLLYENPTLTLGIALVVLLVCAGESTHSQFVPCFFWFWHKTRNLCSSPSAKINSIMQAT